MYYWYKKVWVKLTKIDKKSHRDFDIYYIGYNTIKKVSNYNCNCNCEYNYKNIYNVNPLYLIIQSATGYFEKKYNKKYLNLDSTKKYEEVLSETKS